MRNILSMQDESLPGFGSRHSWLLQAILNPNFTGVVQMPFRPGFRVFAARSYKPLTVFLLSLCVLALCHLKMGAEVSGLIRVALGLGVGCVILSVLMSREWKRMPAKTSVGIVGSGAKLSPDKAVAHVGSLIIGLLGLLLICAKFHNQFTWTIYPTLSLLGGFALGFSGVMMLLHAVSPENSMAAKVQTPAHTYVIPERLDVLAGAVAAGMVLGTTLVEIDAFKGFSLSAGVVWLPAVLAWCGVCASWLTAKVLKNMALDLPPSTGRMLNVFVMTVIAYFLVGNMLPRYWVIEGKEKLSSEIFLAAEIGIIGGFFLMETSCAYVWLRTRYYAWTFGRFDCESWYFKPFRHVFRIVCLAVPVLLVAGFLMYAFEMVGLYGIIVSAVAMLSNLNARLSFGAAGSSLSLPAKVAVRQGNNQKATKPAFAAFFGLVSRNQHTRTVSQISGRRDDADVVPAFAFRSRLRWHHDRRFGGKSSVRPIRNSRVWGFAIQIGRTLGRQIILVRQFLFRFIPEWNTFAAEANHCARDTDQRQTV